MEIVIELILEVFGELLIEVFMLIVGAIFKDVYYDPKKLKITKIVIYSSLAVLLITLLVISLCYKKGLFIILSLSYMIFIALAYYLIFVFRNIFKRPKIEIGVRRTVQILKYGFCITLIVLGSIFLTNQSAKVALIVFASISLIVFIFIDAFRLFRRKREKSIL